MPSFRTDKSDHLSPDAEVGRVYLQLREWLIEGVLPPGQFLSEPELARRCQTSRTPIREACMRLHQDQWLTRFPKKGFLVTPITAPDIVDLCQFRKLLECFAVEKIAQSITQGQLSTLREILAVEHTPEATIAQRVRANETFHLQLASLAGNERVHRQLTLALAFARRLDTLYMQVDESWIAHDDLLLALESHRGAEARQAMAAHIDHAQDCLVKLFGRSPILHP